MKPSLPPFGAALALRAVALASVLWSVRPGLADEPKFAPAGLEFVKKHCISCHGDKDPDGSLSLTVYKDDASLIKGRKTWLKMLQRIESGEMPPEEKPRPTKEEIDAFVKLIRAIYQNHDRNAKPDPGRVTVRRLNRVEYNNTIRELMGVDFNPAEDFPSDDIGHGFDNIGDVLTLSPVLMERYLSAAESIVNRAILTKIPAPARRYLSGRFLQPNNDKTSQGRFRPLDPASTEPVLGGPFAAGGDYLKLTATDELILRANLYAETTETTPVKVALFLSGPNLKDVSPDAEVDQLMGPGLAAMKPMKILKIYEITARAADKVQQIEFPVSRVDGVQRAGIALLKPAEGEKPPTKLHIEHIWSEGPLETRPASHRMLLACSPDKPKPEQTREILTRFATRAYRRPSVPAEVDRLVQIVDAVVAAGEPWEAGIQRAMMAGLVSPKFLFRVELDDRPEAAEPRPLDEFQLASRLSYFLWSSMPDDELFDLAGKGQLVANLDAQINRMLKSPKSRALVENFGLQWLQLQRLKTFAPDPKLFPSFNDQLRAAMQQETVLFLAEIVREDRSILDMLDADYTYLNEPLARHYGLADMVPTKGRRERKRDGTKPVRGEDFIRVTLPDDTRGGLLSQASILTVTSNPTRTSPVKRGKWILEQILGDPPPPPPPNVPELESDKTQLTGSLRQRMEQHRKNPACAQCHARMDPIGFALENYNAVGAWREKDGEFPLETAGELPDKSTFQGPADLKEVLKGRKEQFTRCLTEKLLTYALGRGVEFYDRPVIERIQANVAKGDYRFSVLVGEIVRSEPFRQRRGL